MTSSSRSRSRTSPAQLETDDAVALIEDLDRDEQQAVLSAMEPDDRAAVEEALSYPEESAGRLMQRDLCAVPEHWNVGQVIDYLRSTRDLPDDFWEVFVVNPDHHPVGTCKLSTDPSDAARDARQRHHAARADADPGRHGPGGRCAAFPEICARLGRGDDDSGRLVGMITVDDIVHIIQQEAGEDITPAVGRGRGRHQRAHPADRADARRLADHQPWSDHLFARPSSACSRVRSENMRSWRR